MATRIKLKRSTVAATVPTTSNLEDGEVALNIADKKLYARNGSNIIEVANQKPNTGEVVTTMLSTDITNGQGNTFYVATVGSDNSTLANGGNAGLHPDTPFLTITKALGTATSGDTIVIAPGEYQEVFESDHDNDGNLEPVFLSNIQSNFSTSIIWADWNPNSGITTSTPIQTCDNASSISVGDINGDGDDDNG